MAELVQTPGYPVAKRMSPKHEGTFAHVTLKDRMPRVLTQVIDTIHMQEKTLFSQFGEDGTEDVKGVLSQLSELRYQMQTNKPMSSITSGPDVKEWSAAFDSIRKCKRLQGNQPSWYSVSWLFAECFMYRKIADILKSSKHLKDFDPFGAQKVQSFTTCLEDISAVGKYLNSLLSVPSTGRSPDQLRVEFEHLLLLTLWGNKMDLSMITTVENYDSGRSMFSMKQGAQSQLLKTNVLADHSAALWEVLQLISKPKPTPRRIDFVLDNCGFEIFVDMCLAEWLLSVGFADQVQFHVKQLPWFVSDALVKDFNWTLDVLSASTNGNLSQLGGKWKARVLDRSFVVVDHPFWTTSYEYAAMKTVAPDLYQRLSESYLVIFKGDLNYRKLLADRNWLYTESFSIALGGFEPTNVCALRTLKADLVTGLSPGVADRAASENKDWMITGQYAVLQVHRS